MDKHHKSDKRRTRRTFTPECKAAAVRLCRVGDRSIARIAMNLDLIETVQDPIVDTSVCVNHAASTRKLRRCCAGVL